MRLSDLQRPFICTSLTESTVPETVASLKRAEDQGATAFEVHLPLLDFPTAEDMETITTSTPYPVYATCRRGAFYELLGVDMAVELTDEARTDRLLSAVDAGANGVDVELDLFDPQPGPSGFTKSALEEYATDPSTTPAEVTDDQETIEDQRKFVAAVHDRDADVMFSAHTYKHLTPKGAVAIAERMTARDGDFAKIVGMDRTMDEALETLEAHLRLNEADVIPYALMAIGDASRITRPIAPMFGSAWVFAQPEIVPGGFDSWPLVENAREVLRRVDWRSAYDPHDPA